LILRRNSLRTAPAEVCLRRAAETDSGFAAVDAIVALMIISLTLGLSYAAIQNAEASGRMADEATRADALLRDLIEGRDDALGTDAGSRDGFTWRVETQLTGSDRPIAVCRRAVAITNMRSGRAYATSTLQPCPAGA
jgi:hypothetical protein